MTPQNFREFAEKRQKELAKLLRSDLPRLMGTKAMQHFRGNFARGGFLDDNLQAWPSTWRQQTLSGADGQRGPLLSRTNTLRNRILFRAAPGRVRIYNDLIYAAIHNNGGNITITPILRNTKALKTEKAAAQGHDLFYHFGCASGTPCAMTAVLSFRASVVPLTCNHSQVGASDSTEVYDLVIAAIDVDKSLIKRNVERRNLIVVAKQTLQEGLIREIETRQIVIGTVDKEQVRTVADIQSGQIIVGTYQVKQVFAVAKAERHHVVVGADQRGERRQSADNHCIYLIVIDVKILQAFHTGKIQGCQLVVAAIKVLELRASRNVECFKMVALTVERLKFGYIGNVQFHKQIVGNIQVLERRHAIEVDVVRQTVFVEGHLLEHRTLLHISRSQHIAARIELGERRSVDYGNGRKLVARHIDFSQ